MGDLLRADCVCLHVYLRYRVLSLLQLRCWKRRAICVHNIPLRIEGFHTLLIRLCCLYRLYRLVEFHVFMYYQVQVTWSMSGIWSQATTCITCITHITPTMTVTISGLESSKLYVLSKTLIARIQSGSGRDIQLTSCMTSLDWLQTQSIDVMGVASLANNTFEYVQAKSLL